MNMIKLLLIHFTFVVEIEPTGKKIKEEAASLEKDFQRNL